MIERAEDKKHWNLITWAKTNPVPTCNNKYLPDVEYVIHAYDANGLQGDYEDKQSFFLQKTGGSTTDHPNEKPFTLMTKLVKLSSLAGQTVLDPFTGSGTTGVACVQLGRRFIGIEIEERYCEIAAKRIQQAQRQMRMF